MSLITMSTSGFYVCRNGLVDGRCRHDWEVPDLDDVRHRLPVHRRVVPHQRQERGRRHGLDLRQDRLHLSPLHCRPFGIFSNVNGN